MKYEELVNNHAAGLTENLVTEVVTKDPAEISCPERFSSKPCVLAERFDRPGVSILVSDSLLLSTYACTSPANTNSQSQAGLAEK